MIHVELSDAARDDLLQLREHLRARHGAPLSGEFAELEDDANLLAVQHGAIRALATIRDNPWIGAENRARTGSRRIVDGRHVYFDREGYRGRHAGDMRFRIVYRLEPTKGRRRGPRFTQSPSERANGPTNSLSAAGPAPTRSSEAVRARGVQTPVQTSPRKNAYLQEGSNPVCAFTTCGCNPGPHERSRTASIAFDRLGARR